MPEPKPSFLELDRQHQRLVADYQPVSRALTSYELAYREWQAGGLRTAALRLNTRRLHRIVVGARRRVRRDPATGETARVKQLLLAALEARARALGSPAGGRRYQVEWTRSVVDARRALTTLQEIRDRALLIPLPEDSVS